MPAQRQVLGPRVGPVLGPFGRPFGMYVCVCVCAFVSVWGVLKVRGSYNEDWGLSIYLYNIHTYEGPCLSEAPSGALQSRVPACLRGLDSHGFKV